MSVYHIIIKTSYQPNWGTRLEKFWSALKASGIKTDEKVLYIEDESQVDLIYSLASENDITLCLSKSKEE